MALISIKRTIRDLELGHLHAGISDTNCTAVRSVIINSTFKGTIFQGQRADLGLVQVNGTII